MRIIDSMRRLSSTLILVLAMLATPGCESADAPRLPTVQMPIGDRTFTLEVADSVDEQRTGLMNRDTMPLDHGMIFVFPVEAPRAFWMKSTRINLDILYVDATRKVVDIKTMQAYDMRSVPAAAPAKYAIELNAGVASLCGVKIGDELNIPESAREPHP